MRAQDDIILRDEQAPLVNYQPSQPMAPALPPEMPEPSILGGIFRHFWLVILFCAIGAGGAMTFLKYARPLYTSEARIYIKPSSGPRVLAETLGSTQRSNYLYTQADIIKSTPLLKIIIEQPEIKAMKTWELSKGEPLLYLREELQAEVDRKNDIISIWIRTPYAEESAAIVTAVVKAYEDHQGVEKTTSSKGLIGTMENTLETSKKELAKLEADLNEFRKFHPNVNIEGVYQGQLLQYNQSVTAATIERIQLQATMGPGNGALLAARDKEERLLKQYEDAREQLSKFTGDQWEFQKKVADVAAKRDMVKQLETKINDLTTARQADQIVNQVDIIEPARIAERPSFPRKTTTLAASIVLGALLGAGLALLRDRSDGRMRSVEEIQTVINLPILGVVPAMGGRRAAVARAMTVHLDPRSVVAEAYRTIRTAVYFGANGNPCKTLLVTSPEPGDGKTTSASNLAIAIAQTGRSVLLLDADFRKPSQHKNLEIKTGGGLSSVLAGAETLEQAIQRTGVEGLDILPCGPIPSNPSEILNSREFGELVDTLAARYDHVIFDSPPVNAVTDARILGAVCDATILVLRADKSTRKAGEHARNALMGVGARIFGAIVNDAPNSKAYEAYGGSYYGTADVASRPSDRSQNSLRRLPAAAAQASS